MHNEYAQECGKVRIWECVGYGLFIDWLFVYVCVVSLIAMELDVLTADISKAYDDLRTIEESIISLSGKERFGTGRRRILDSGSRPNNYGYERRDARTVSLDSSGPNKRRLVISAENDLYEGSDKRARYDDREDEAVRRTVQSSVVMPTIETKSRKAAISELKGAEKRKNRRMFSNLLLGTLQRFQMDEKKISSVEKVQAEKQKEVERRLRESEEEERERLAREKAALLGKRREKERLIKSLQRRKAIIQYAEQKQEHYRKLQNFIQTKAKPPVFYLPAKHTLRTLELLKVSSKKIDALIEHRRQQMEADLKTPENKQIDEGESDAEHSETPVTMRSSAKMNATNKPSDSEIGSKNVDGDETKEREVVAEVSMESSLRDFGEEECTNGDEEKGLKQLHEDEQETGKDNNHSDSEPPGDEAEIDQDGDSHVAFADEDD
ncbi:Pinin [Dirofilaria immitis]|nr:Pinin [Dirofilaria immitis]